MIGFIGNDCLVLFSNKCNDLSKEVSGESSLDKENKDIWGLYFVNKSYKKCVIGESGGS